jgi:hypothetical protein
MADPITVGALVALALSSTAGEVFKSTVSEVVKDAYKALREKILPVAGHDIAALEKTPTSKARQEIIAELVDGLPADQREPIRALANQLIKASIKEPATSDIVLTGLHARGINVGGIVTTEGKSRLEVSNSVIDGILDFGGIKTGKN